MLLSHFVQKLERQLSGETIFEIITSFPDQATLFSQRKKERQS
jgi:hypothetical protein